MSRFFLVVLIAVLLAAFAFYMNWFSLSTTTDAARDTTKIELTVDKAKVREDADTAKEKAAQFGEKMKEDAGVAKQKAEEFGEKAKTEVKEVTRKTERTVEKKTAPLELSRQRVELQAGSSTDVVVTRSSSELRPVQVGLTPSAGSNLRASGGLFAEGQTQATLTVNAPLDAHTGTVEITSEGKAETLNVTVLPEATDKAR